MHKHDINRSTYHITQVMVIPPGTRELEMERFADAVHLTDQGSFTIMHIMLRVHHRLGVAHFRHELHLGSRMVRLLKNCHQLIETGDVTVAASQAKTTRALISLVMRMTDG